MQKLLRCGKIIHIKNKLFWQSVRKGKSYWHGIQIYDIVYCVYPYVSGEFTPSECHAKRKQTMIFHVRNGHDEQGMKLKS